MVATAAMLALALLPGPSVPHRAIHAIPAAATGSWTTYHHDDGHTGYDAVTPQMSSATTGWVSPTLDGTVFGEPLVYNGLVYAGTLNNTVYALDQSTGAVAWSMNLGAPETAGWQCGNVAPMGIFGTPVIDPAGGRIYVAAFFSDDTYHVIGLSLATGAVQMDTTLSIPGFDWTIQQERGALALHNGYVYVPFGGRIGDCGVYHGYVVAVPTNGSTTIAIYQTPGSGSGIWAAGGPVVDDTTGAVFASTGNGNVSNGCSSVNQNDAVVRLNPVTMALQDWFMPQDWQGNWCSNDQDLGSAGPLLVSPSLLFQAGKHGGGFLLNPNSLGGVDGQVYPARSPYSQADVCFGNTGDATFGSFAYAAPFVYVECEGQGLVALDLNASAPSFAPCSSSCGAPDWTTGGTSTFGPPIVAGGAVWAIDIGGGGLYAFDKGTGAQLFHSGAFPVQHFVTPSEAGGQVFVPSNDVIRSFNMSFLYTSQVLGGYLTTGPGSSSWGSASADAFVGGTDGGLWHIGWNGTSWSGWQPLGGIITADPTAASWGANRIDTFVRGTDRGLWQRTWNGSTWSNWTPLGGILTTGPGAATQGSGMLDVVVRGTDNGLWIRSYRSGAWTNWQSLGGGLTSDPAAVSWGAGRLDVFLRGGDGGLWHRAWDSSTGWHGWEWLGGLLTSAPSASSCLAGTLDVWALGTDGGLWRRSYSSGAWGGWQSMGGQWTSRPSATCRPGTTTIDVYERATNGALWHLGF